MSEAEIVRASTEVPLDPDAAFRLFTDEVDLWWKHGPRFRPALHGEGTLRFEPGKGGRLIEVYADGETFEFAEIVEWEPGKRLLLAMKARAMAAGESTEVEIVFDATPRGTRVRLEHRGWERFPADHAVRHGHSGNALAGWMGLWWSELLLAARLRAKEKTS